MPRIDPAAAARLPRTTLKNEIAKLVQRDRDRGADPAQRAARRSRSPPNSPTTWSGSGPLEPFLDDDEVTDILVNGPFEYLRRAARQARKDRGPVSRRAACRQCRAAHRLGGRPAHRRGEPDGRRPARRRQPRQYRPAAARAEWRHHLDPQIPQAEPHARYDGAAAEPVGRDGAVSADRRALARQHPDLGRHRLGQDDIAERDLALHRPPASASSRSRTRSSCGCSSRMSCRWKRAPPNIEGVGADPAARACPQRAAHAPRPHHRRRGARPRSLRHAAGDEHRA